MKRKIITLTVNADNEDALIESLSRVIKMLSDGERDGICGCKWWIDSREVDD